jgi:hypothetical protein
MTRILRKLCKTRGNIPVPLDRSTLNNRMFRASLSTSLNTTRGGATKGLTCLALAVALLAACHHGPMPRSADEAVHLVIDAGSSGTRYCAFRVASARAGQCSIVAKPVSNPCVDIAARNGLADLEPAEVERVLSDGLRQLPAEVRANVRSAALLGTGGFRRRPEADQLQTIGVIERWFERERIPASAKVISGDEEGRLAWFAVRELNGSRRHTIIETGGATVQIASGVDGVVRALSTATGMNDSRRKLQADGRYRSCQSNDDSATGQDAERCIALISEQVFSDSTHANPGFAIDATAYGLGAPWIALFDRYLKADRVDLTSLRGLADRVCKLSAAEVVAAGYDDGPFAATACYLSSYHVAQIEATRTIKQVLRGGESWPRGAAVDGKYFSSCSL